MALFPWCCAHATTRGPLDAVHVPPPLDHHPPWVPWSSTIKALAPGAPELSHRPAATLWPSTAHPSQERRGGRGRRRGSAEAARHRRCRRSGGRRPDQARRRCATLHCTALHCFRSYTAATRHCVTILSSTTPKVSPGFPLLVAGPRCVGHGALHRERVGQGRLRPLGTHALTRTSTTMP